MAKKLQVLGDLLSGLPSVSESDNGKILKVVNGKWAIVEMPVYEGEFEVTPAVDVDQTLLTAQKLVDANIKVTKIPYAEVSNSSNGVTATIG